MLFRKSRHVVLISETEGQASDFLNDIKVPLQENENLIELFGVRKFEKESQTEIIVQMDDGHLFRIIAKGAEQKVRGTKWRGVRPDLVIGDDMEGDEQVLNRDRRDKFKKWVHGAVLPALSDKGRARFVGTILHLDSFLEGHMPDEKDPDSVFTDLCVTHAVPGSLWASARYRAHTDDFEHILWPEKFSREYLKQIRHDYVSRGYPEVYAQEYLNYPIDESTAFFRRDDFIHYDILPERLRYYAAIDFAISEKERADYTVIAVCGVDDVGMIYVVDILRGRWDALEIIDNMLTVQKRYEPDMFTAEGGMIEKAIGPFLKTEMFKRGVFINLNPKTPVKDKKSRASSFQARTRAGGVKYKTDASWFPTLQQEMLRFPKDIHDDQVDALAWIGLTLAELQEAPTPQEWDDEQYDEEYGDIAMGKSLITGY